LDENRRASEARKITLGEMRNRPVADRGWKRRFDEPIPLPRGRQLVTLQDAGTYITKLPKAEQQLEEWLAAIEALILVAEQDGPTMMARIGVMRALNRHVERVFNPDRKDHQGPAEAEARRMTGNKKSRRWVESAAALPRYTGDQPWSVAVFT
jgi:hypothetical protein